MYCDGCACVRVPGQVCVLVIFSWLSLIPLCGSTYVRAIIVQRVAVLRRLRVPGQDLQSEARGRPGREDQTKGRPIHLFR